MCADSTGVIRREQGKRGRTQFLLKSSDRRMRLHANHTRAVKILVTEGLQGIKAK